jgi:hypothetical protein
LGKGLYLLTDPQKGSLPRNDRFDPISKLLPLFLGQRKVRAQVQEGSLPGASLGSQGLDQLMRMVFPSLFALMGCAAQKHAVKLLPAPIEVKEKTAYQFRFWHYKHRLACNLLILLGRISQNPQNWPFGPQKTMNLG